jgi:RNA:NAD 2'-phosphotransferase (TPT1/KptA family)
MPTNTLYEDGEKVSHWIAHSLRHNKHFIHLNKMTGWCNLKALYDYLRIPFEWLYFISIIQRLVNPVDAKTKVRYQLNSTGSYEDWKIRALQGHSIKTIIIDDHIPVTDADRNILLIHGTPNRYIESIRNEGLKKFRNDIHFVPVGAPTMMTHLRDRNAGAFLYITVGVLLDNGFHVFRSPNNVYLVREDCIPYDLMWELGTPPWEL